MTPEVAAEYEYDLSNINTNAIIKAEEQMNIAYQHYYHTKGWFWQCNSVCTQNYEVYMHKKSIFDGEVAIADQQLSNAKAKVGLFSEYGVGETRDMFWQRFSQGGKYAKRATMWDALFIGISSMGRDEQLGSYILRLIGNFLLNLTMGLIMALVSFTFSLWSIVTSFQASFGESMVFWGFAVLAAGAFVSTFIVGMFGAVAGTVFVVAKAAGNQRLENGRRQQRVGYGNPRGFRRGYDPHHVD